MVRFNGKYDSIYPRYTREQLKPEYRQEPEGTTYETKVLVINFNGAVLHSYQRPCISTVGEIQQGLAIFSELKLCGVSGEGEILALFKGIDYEAYSKLASKVCSRWHDPKSIMGDLEKELLLQR